MDCRAVGLGWRAACSVVPRGQHLVRAVSCSGHQTGSHCRDPESSPVESAASRLLQAVLRGQRGGPRVISCPGGGPSLILRAALQNAGGRLP